MKYLLWVFLVVIIVTCSYFGGRHLFTDGEKQDSVDTVVDTISVPRLSDEDIDEIIRMTDSIKKYGMKKGVRRYHKDSVHITDEDSQMVSNMTHEVLDELGINYKNKSK